MKKTKAKNVDNYQRAFEEQYCDYQNVMMKMLIVLIYLNSIFQNQMQQRMFARFVWNNVIQYWKKKMKRFENLSYVFRIVERIAIASISIIV